METRAPHERDSNGDLLRRTEKALRYQAVLLDLAKTDWGDLPTALAKITELDAKNLEVARVSVWLFTPDRNRIVCEDMFLFDKGIHLRGQTLFAKDYPRYFRALEESRTIPAHDAVTDPRTSEFAETYLRPQRISSMLDVPFRLSGKVVGIVCHEHVGPQRQWSLEDQEFASAVADMVSLAYNAEARREAERALQKKSQELEQSNKELEHFTYVASHDLQEPLYSIIALSDRLQSLYAATLEEKGADLLQRIRRSAARLQQLVNDLLEFSRMDGKPRPTQRVEPHSVLTEIEKDLESRIRETGGKVRAESLPAVEVDPVQLRRLFQNLISNALKFHRKDQKPDISIRGRDLGNGYCEFTVEDDGIGFEEKYLEQIFQPFSRLHSYAEYQGSGIGLAVCQKIVRWYGGEITARSRLGTGSTFIFTLPTAK